MSVFLGTRDTIHLDKSKCLVNEAFIALLKLSEEYSQLDKEEILSVVAHPKLVQVLEKHFKNIWFEPEDMDAYTLEYSIESL